MLLQSKIITWKLISNVHRLIFKNLNLRKKDNFFTYTRERKASLHFFVFNEGSFNFFRV